MFLIDQLENLVSEQELNNLRLFLKKSKWNYKVPGGFLTNFPQRKVNTYGDGRYIDNNGNLIGHKWNKTYWTAKQTQNNVTLETLTEEMPSQLCAIIPKIRDFIKHKISNNVIDINSFNIAVCNNYTEPTMNIAEHTDDNYWYPKEIERRPIFVSLTFYLDGKPNNDKYSRFQLKIDGKWKDIKLEDNSILYMNSDIPHRVLKHKKKDFNDFRPRVNITLRSTFKIEKNPLLHNICVANHTRYYRFPNNIISNGKIDDDKINEILNNYNLFCKNNEYPDIGHIVSENHNKKIEFINVYNKIIKNKGLDKVNMFKTNIVTETIQEVCNYLENI